MEMNQQLQNSFANVYELQKKMISPRIGELVQSARVDVGDQKKVIDLG